ncbi:hypothetical protein LTR16_000592 [Cryomyces antarcticus]|uniref:AGC-kinase C-terminal domain-containing protein n=1 Tax=Cryomyces antarcticus TaxID=329879 RepID=A0ABR0M044_9PEZI|nr:hypothetical protein LTR16_000592 [Cryomyces antarcticus]
MFSYFRSHHKRSDSAPASPAPTSSAMHYQMSPLRSSDSHNSLSPPQTQDAESLRAHTPVSPYPPVLPPIPRVASRHKSDGGDIQPLTRPQRTFIAATQDRSHSTLHEVQQTTAEAHATTVPNKDLPSTVDEQSIEEDRTIEESVPYTSVSSSRSPSSILRSSYQPSTATSLLNDKPFTFPPQQIVASTPPLRAGKSKLNLRNPMSLLMRRWSAQVLETLSDNALVSNRNFTTPSMKMPDDYDPRIRGKGVHDFSAPRPRRNFSYNDIDIRLAEQRTSQYPEGSDSLLETPGRSLQRPQSAEYHGTRKEREHTPVFVENFEEDAQSRPVDSAIRAEALANHEFLSRLALRDSDHDQSSLPPFARRSLPLTAVDENHVSNANTDESQSSPPLTPVVEVSPVISPVSSTPPRSPRTPPQSRSRASSSTEHTSRCAGSLRHLPSTASRFSFQLGGVGSAAQEKMLEEKHKQLAVKRQPSDPGSGEHEDDEEQDEFDEGAMYDYDEINDGEHFQSLEPEFPGPGLGRHIDLQLPPSMANFDFSPNIPVLSSPMSPTSVSGGLPGTSRDPDGNAIGFAVTDTPPELYQQGAPIAAGEQNQTSSMVSKMVGLGLVDCDETKGFTRDSDNETKGLPFDQNLATRSQWAHGPTENGDDFYFDDGLIEDPDELHEYGFEESVFDNPSHPLYERRSANQISKAMQQGRSDVAPSKSIVDGADESQGDTTPDSPYNTREQRHPEGASDDRWETSMSQGEDPHHNPVLDYGEAKGGIAAYHSALAEAAIKAAAAGRFSRHDSINQEHVLDGYEDDREGPAPDHSSRPSLVPDEGRQSQDTQESFAPGIANGNLDDYEDNDYDYDSNYEDDPIIAAANAEALANDEDGFYGQEFGFYGQANGKTGDSEAQFGGYFGPPGSEGLGRKKSLKEPNLTPITERSEFSTRNSFIGMGHFGPSPVGGSLPSPGLAYLARLSPYGFGPDEDDMTLSQLQKLRKGAFDSSNASLRSANSSPVGIDHSPLTSSYFHPGGSSPMVLQPSSHSNDSDGPTPRNPSKDVSNGRQHGRAEASALDSDSINAHHSPETPSSPLQDLDPTPKRGHSAATSGAASPSPCPATATTRRDIGAAWRSHSRSGSGTDRVSTTYVQERDGAGGNRWVLERRRTAESGELELVREVVEGGRI